MNNFLNRLIALAFLCLLAGGVLFFFFSEKTVAHVSWNPHDFDSQVFSRRTIQIFETPQPFVANKVTIDFRIRPTSFPTNANVFQTADGNNGLRMEITNDGSVGIVVGATDAMGLRGLLLPIHLQTHTWYSVRIYLESEHRFSVWINGRSMGVLNDDSIRCRMDQLACGSGFSKTRNFDGQIVDFRLKAFELKPRATVKNVARMLLQYSVFLMILLVSIGIGLRFRKTLPRIALFMSVGGMLIAWILLMFFSMKVTSRVSWRPTLFDSRSVGQSAVQILDVDQPDYADHMDIHFRFRPCSFPDHANVFQTADVNDGLRMELTSNGQLGLAVGSSGLTGLRGLPFSLQLVVGTWYTVRILWDIHKGLSAWVDGKPMGVLEGSDLRCRISHAAIGTGFSKTRNFDGQIADFELKALLAHPRFRVESLAQTLLKISASLFGLQLFIFAAAHARWDLKSTMRQISLSLLKA